MKVRQAVYDTYWRFAALRQDIFFSRIRNLPRPWTHDYILNTFKFCNTYRASDRVSQYLIKNVIYDGEQNAREVIFRILLFKIFNKIETWKYLQNKLENLTLSTFDVKVYDRILQEALDGGSAIYTSAYMSCANKAFGFDRKHQNHLALIHKMLVTDNVSQKIEDSKGLIEVYQLLRDYPLIGDFMAYQLAIDLNYSNVINFNENDFTTAGPGAERGIRKCFVDTCGKSNGYIIQWMTDNQDKEFERLGLSFQSLFGRKLHAIDCQGLFCETDKYCRVAFPELTSNRVRIKAKFSPNHETINYFFPPKWGINDNVNTYIAYARQSTNTIKVSLFN